MNVQEIAPYVNRGTNVLDNCIKKYIYEYNYRDRKYTPTYATIIRDQGGDKYWQYGKEWKGGIIKYRVDSSNGDLIISCDGKHTEPFCYMYMDSLSPPIGEQYMLQDAHYHLSGCPSGGSKNTYFMYLGPYSYTYKYMGYDNYPVFVDMGFDESNIDIGNGVDVDARGTNFYKFCQIGNRLVDGTDISRTEYTVTTTGLHGRAPETAMYNNLYFVVMPGTVLDNLVVPRPKLIKTDEAYYKGDDVLSRPLPMSPIDGYSYYLKHNLRIDYDWDTDRWHIYGTLQKEYNDAGIDIPYIDSRLLTAGHQYKFVVPKLITSDDRIYFNWYLSPRCLVYEQDSSYCRSGYILGDTSWQLNYTNKNRYEYSDWKPMYIGNIYKSTINNSYYYDDPEDEYIFTVKRESYDNARGEIYLQRSNIYIGLFDVPDGTVMDFYIQAPKLISLSGPERPKPPGPNPDPPPPRPEPAKPAEPDIVWNLGTSFVISPDSYETGLLDNYESLIWNEVYNDVGDFEVYTCVDDDILKICKPGNMITRADSDKIMIIESVKITTDVESGNHITVKGRSYESVLDRRIIWDQTTVSGSVHDAIKKLITDAIIEPKNECRKIDNFIFEDSTEEAVLQYQMDEAQFEGESLLESIKKICDIFHLGFKIYMNEEGQFAFKLYSGTDRSYYQEDLPYVIFSHNFGNLLDSEFITDSYNYKTTMLVMSDVEDDTIKTKRVTIGDGYSGMNRREVSYKSSTSPNKESGAGKYTNEEFARMLNEDGTRQLTEYKVVNQFQGSADIHQMYIYGEDFFLGDIVQIVDEFGNSACSRVNRLVISHDSNGIYSYPEFEVFERGNKVKISTGSMDADNPSINVKYNDSLTTEHFASEYSTEYTSLYGLVGVAYELVQEKSFTIKSLKRVMFRGKIYDENTVLATFPFNVFTDLEINEYIDEEETYS